MVDPHGDKNPLTGMETDRLEDILDHVVVSIFLKLVDGLVLWVLPKNLVFHFVLGLPEGRDLRGVDLCEVPLLLVAGQEPE